MTLIFFFDNENIAELSDGLQEEIYLDEEWFSKFSKYGEIDENRVKEKKGMKIY